MQIIAEIGSNWRKSENQHTNLDVAKRQIYLASKCGATAVKFQYFSAQELYGPAIKGTSFEENFNRFNLPNEWLPILYDECERNGVEFLCSAFSVMGFEQVDDFVRTHKIASPELSDPNITNFVMKTGKPFYYSNGCSNISLAGGVPMACVSRYPAHHSDYDLKPYANSQWGLSDHTLTNDLAQFSLMLGATHFEKHVDFLLDLGLRSPDSIASIDKSQFISFSETITEFDSERYDKLQRDCMMKYGRKKVNNAYYRPFPES
jgi:N-acetylneuraminate synthase